MITFPQLDSNISTDPAYGLYTSQLILDFDIMFLLRSSWQFVFRRYTTLLYSEHWTIKSRIFLNNRLVSSFKKFFFSEHNNTLLKSMLSVAYRRRKMILTIMFLLQIDFFFLTIMY